MTLFEAIVTGEHGWRSSRAPTDSDGWTCLQHCDTEPLVSEGHHHCHYDHHQEEGAQSSDCSKAKGSSSANVAAVPADHRTH